MHINLKTEAQGGKEAYGLLEHLARSTYCIYLGYVFKKVCIENSLGRQCVLLQQNDSYLY